MKVILYFFLQRKLGCDLPPPPRHTAFSQTFTPRTYGGTRQRRADDTDRVAAAGDRVVACTDRVAAGTGRVAAGTGRVVAGMDRVAAGADPFSGNRADCVSEESLARWV
jgi:X-X-X-Leu-X-X-Gly heptad repeat protein